MSPWELQCLPLYGLCLTACHHPVSVLPNPICVHALSPVHSPFEKQMARPKLCAEESYHSYHGPWQRPAAGAERSPEGKWEQRDKPKRAVCCHCAHCTVWTGRRYLLQEKRAHCIGSDRSKHARVPVSIESSSCGVARSTYGHGWWPAW